MVHVKAPKEISKVVIEGEEILNVGPKGADAALPIHFGPAAVAIFDGDRLLFETEIQRTRMNPMVFGFSVGASAVFSPVLAVAGGLLVNPSWMYASSVFLQGGGVGAFWAYLAQTASIWTIPAMLLGALVGAIPLIGLMAAERYEDVVVLGVPNF